MIRRSFSQATRVVGSAGFLKVAIGLLALSAVLGNVAQLIDRGRAEQRAGNLRSALVEQKAETQDVQSQLARTKGEQECRSQVAADSEVYAGRLQVGLSNLVIAAQQKDEAGIGAAIHVLSENAPLLLEALDARQQSITTCKEAP